MQKEHTSYITAKAKYLALKQQVGGQINHTENKDMYWTLKEVDFKSYNSSNAGTVTDGKNTVYFIAEKLSDKNIDFWKEYNSNQSVNTIRNGAHNNKGNAIHVNDGIASFKTDLLLYSPYNTFDTWIGYASSELFLGAKNYRNYDNIEMTVGLFISEKCPITSHMGISRNYKYFGAFNDVKIHGNLAMLLHSFLAKFSTTLYPDSQKLYMITRPTYLMRDIFINAFTKYATKNNIELTEIVSIGDSIDRKDFIIKKQEYDTSVQSRKKYLEEIPEKLRLYQHDLECITNTNDDTNIDDFNIKEMKILTEDNYKYVFSKLNRLYKKSPRVFIYMKKELIEYINKQIANLNVPEIPFEKMKIEIIPADPNIAGLFNDSDPNNWSIKNGSKTVEFVKPAWYEHPDLKMRILYSSIVSLPALGSMFD